MPIKAETWLLLDSGPGRPEFNMALDEALLESAAERGKPVLRLYGWTEAAATFGYFQKYADVAAMTNLRPLIRRPTGGGLVPHAADWTYSVVVPPSHPWFALRARASYQRVHAWVSEAFTRLNIRTELAPTSRQDLPGQCFAGAEQFDVLWQQAKIAGAAQRRNRRGLLIQGSVQPPPLSLARTEWERALRDEAAVRWRIAWVTLETEAAVACRAAELAAGKYSQASHNQRR